MESRRTCHISCDTLDASWSHVTHTSTQGVMRYISTSYRPESIGGDRDRDRGRGRDRDRKTATAIETKKESKIETEIKKETETETETGTEIEAETDTVCQRVAHASTSHVTHINEPCRTHRRDMSRTPVRCQAEAYSVFQICDMTHFDMGRDSLICVTCLIEMCDMPH